MLTTAISNFAVKCLDATGYFGAGLLMALESMIAPVPSEAVMPFVGFLVADGSWNLWLAIGVTSLGSLIGSLISYAMGYYGGKPVVLKVGRYLLLNPHDLVITERFFQPARRPSHGFHQPLCTRGAASHLDPGRHRPDAARPFPGGHPCGSHPVEYISFAVRDETARTLASGANVLPPD